MSLSIHNQDAINRGVPPGERYIPVLDKGYVIPIEFWGSDERIIESARMSTDGAFRGWGPRHHATCPTVNLIARIEARKSDKEYLVCTCDSQPGDEKLLRYLYTHAHLTPFEMCGMTVEVKAPIMVFREWHRHRTQSYNEMSARYIPLPNEDYLPTVERCLKISTTNKQAAALDGIDGVDSIEVEKWLQGLAAARVACQEVYEWGLDIGIPKELARLALTVSRYSKMRASANLRNWLAFLTLRMDNAAQEEIRLYANAVGELIAERFPRTWELFVEGREG